LFTDNVNPDNGVISISDEGQRQIKTSGKSLGALPIYAQRQGD
jgi:hypothetical protein